jgi:hypothetical protein
MMRIRELLGDRVAITASGTLERSDYDRVVPQLEDAIAEWGKLRILIELQDFRGWRPGALLDELRFDARHRNDFSRCAVVGDRASERWITELTAPLVDGEVRFFASDELDAACDWLEALGAPGAAFRTER